MTTNFKRPNRGAQLLSRVADSGREVAVHMGVSSSTAGYWRSGERKPNPEDRERLKDRYGIPVEAWEQAPATMGRPRAAADDPAASPPPSSATPVASQAQAGMVDVDVDVTSLDATLHRNAARLNRMILTDIARLEGKDGAALELGKRAEILKKLSDAQVSLAKATGETSLNIERIVAHPEFHSAVRTITEAIAPFPDALKAATTALESLGT